MQKSLIFIILFISVIQLCYITTSVNAACSSVKQCLHGAVFNNLTCVCDCFESYNGDYCEHADCSKQSAQCGTDFTVDMCSITLVSNLCPVMCKSSVCTNNCNGFDSCINGGTFNSATCSCSCPSPWNGQICENQCANPLVCQNNAKFNGNTCVCDCFPSYNGSLCQNLQCSVPDPTDCNYYLASDCSVSIISSYCPHLCGKCSQNITCNKSCQNGGYLNTATCACECYQNYNGLLCENILCNVTQPASCVDFTTSQCTIAEVFNYCPFLCGKCISTTVSANITIAPTTASATTVSANITIAPTTASATTVSANITIASTTASATTVSANTTIAPTTASATTIGATTISQTTVSVTTAKPCGITCSYGMTLDLAKCLCNCLPGFSQPTCSNFNCSSTIQDAPECATGLFDCSQQSDYASCPRLCGVPCTSLTTASATTAPTPQATTQAITTTASQTTIPMTTAASITTVTSGLTTAPQTTLSQSTAAVVTTKCASLNCAYGQTYDSVNCKCDCLPGFSGLLCDAFDCANSTLQDPIECSQGLFDCSLSTDIATCPRLCQAPCTQTTFGQTTVAQTTIQQTTQCVPFACQNGGTFDNVTCACQCFPNFYGNACQYLNCIQDQNSCSSLDTTICTVSPFQYVCPFLCGICGTTAAQTTAVVTTKCASLNCAYGQTYDSVNCKCDCLPGFSGLLCDAFDCANSTLQDPIECSQGLFDCSLSTDIATCPRLCQAPCA